MLLALALDHLDELLAALFGERRNGHPHQLRVAHGIHPQARGVDRFLDHLDHGLLPGLDDDQPRVRHGDVGHVLQRREGAVVVDPHALQQRGVGAAGAHLGQLAPQVIQRLVDPVAQVVDDVVCQAHRVTSPAAP